MCNGVEWVGLGLICGWIGSIALSELDFRARYFAGLRDMCKGMFVVSSFAAFTSRLPFPRLPFLFLHRNMFTLYCWVNNPHVSHAIDS